MVEFPSDHSVFGRGSIFPYKVSFDPGRASHLSRVGATDLHVRVVTERAITAVMLVTRGDGVHGHPLAATREASDQTVWEALLPVGSAAFEYSFALQNERGEGVYLTPAGVSNAVERLDRWRYEPVPQFHTPDWAKGALIYQIFPDRFANADPSVNPVETDPWGADPHHTRFQGGDLAGITGKVPYLADLGVELVYLNPIFEAPSNHRYDTIDYYTVDPALGGNAAFGQLVEELHRHDIRIMLDASFNHVHPRFFAFADLVQNGPDSRYADWFVVNEWPLRFGYRPHAADGEAARRRLDWWAGHYRDTLDIPMETLADPGWPWQATYESWYGLPHMPRVNLADPEARSYMLDVAGYWVDEFGIDGWRMDVARYVDADFWDDFRAAVKATNPDVLLLSEVMGDAGDWLNGRRFDGTMDYTFRQLCVDFFARDVIDPFRFWDGLVRLHAMYAPPVTAVNQHLLDSHDTARFRTEAGGEADRLVLATAFQLTYPGSPGLLYGGEIGLEGGDDPGSRVAMPWGESIFEEPTAVAIRALLALRAANADLRSGPFSFGGVDEHGLWYRRGDLGVAFNRSARPALFPLTGEVRWGEAGASRSGVELAPMSAAVIG